MECMQLFGFGIGYRVEQLMLLPALGLNCCFIFGSNNYGAKKYDRVIETVKYLLNMDFNLNYWNYNFDNFWEIYHLFI